MADISRLVDAIRGWSAQFEIAEPVYGARIVSAGDDVGTMTVDMIRPDGSIAERRAVLGNVVAWPGVYVRTAIDRKAHGPSELAIVGVDTIMYGASSSVPVLMGPHGDLHGYQQADEATTLHPDQMYPLRVQPSAGLIVAVIPGVFFADGLYRMLESSVDVDLTASQPGAGLTRYVMTSLNAAAAVTVTDGIAAAAVDITSVPLAPSGEYPLAAVRLQSWVAEITRENIWGLKHILPGDPGVTIETVNKLVAGAWNEFDDEFSRHLVEG